MKLREDQYKELRDDIAFLASVMHRIFYNLSQYEIPVKTIRYEIIRKLNELILEYDPEFFKDDLKIFGFEQDLKNE